jgi:hypothetical protein
LNSCQISAISSGDATFLVVTARAIESSVIGRRRLRRQSRSISCRE